MLNIKEIKEATLGNFLCGNLSSSVRGISIDSRTIKEGELFIALVGKRFDAHFFIQDAINKGAKAVIINRKNNNKEEILRIINKNEIAVLEVENTEKSLIDLAYYFRKKIKIPIISVSGSCGKTTTKFLLETILKKKYSVLASPASYNNQIGVPLSLLSIRKDHQIAIIEIGMNKFGEIEELSKIVLPNIGIMTNIGLEHLEGVGNSIEGVLSAEFELVKIIKQYNGLLILNADDKYILKNIKKIKYDNVIFYGIKNKKNKKDFSAEVLTHKLPFIEFFLYTPSGNIFISTKKLLGMHNIYNILGAATCASILGVSLEDIKEAVEDFFPVSMRLELQKINNFFLLNDAYNANPTSVKAALKVLKNIYYIEGKKINKKIFIFGDMVELGKAAVKLHQDLAKDIEDCGVDILITVGNLTLYTADKLKNKLKIYNCQDLNDINNIKKILKTIIEDNDIILIKGSRVMRMERIKDALSYIL